MRVCFVPDHLWSQITCGLRWQKKQDFKLLVFTLNFLIGFTGFMYNSLKWIWALVPDTNVDLWTDQASQNRTDGYIASDSLPTHCRMTHSTHSVSTLISVFVFWCYLSVQLVRNCAHSIKWLLFHLKLRSTWAGCCWLASGRKWSIAPCPGPHPVHSWYRSRRPNMFL